MNNNTYKAIICYFIALERRIFRMKALRRCARAVTMSCMLAEDEELGGGDFEGAHSLVNGVKERGRVGGTQRVRVGGTQRVPAF